MKVNLVHAAFFHTCRYCTVFAYFYDILAHFSCIAALLSKVLCQFCNMLVNMLVILVTWMQFEKHDVSLLQHGLSNLIHIRSIL